MSRTLDINETIDTRPIGSFQWLIFALCATLLVVDGYDRCKR